MPSFTVAELADHVRGSVEGDGTRPITGVAPVESAGSADLAFITAPKYARRLPSPPPGALLVPRDLELGVAGASLIRVEDPQLAFARLLPLYHPSRPVVPGVHATAIVEPGAELGERVTVGPHVVVREGARVGTGTRIGPFSVIDRGARLGDDCRIAHSCSILRGVRIGDRVRLHPGVRAGTDGFGYARGPDGAVKIPQVGGLRIGDDVEIGANSTIDRGALGDTVIGARTKIDNLVHIGHNVEVGEDCMIVAQVGIAGSVRIGRGAALAGQAGIAGHLTIGPGARIAAQAGVIGDVPAGASYSGYPARPHAKAMRASAALLRLPGALRRLRAIERRLGLAEGDEAAPEGPGPDRPVGGAGDGDGGGDGTT